MRGGYCRLRSTSSELTWSLSCDAALAGTFARLGPRVAPPCAIQRLIARLRYPLLRIRARVLASSGGCPHTARRRSLRGSSEHSWACRRLGRVAMANLPPSAASSGLTIHAALATIQAEYQKCVSRCLSRRYRRARTPTSGTRAPAPAGSTRRPRPHGGPGASPCGSSGLVRSLLIEYGTLNARVSWGRACAPW